MGDDLLGFMSAELQEDVDTGFVFHSDNPLLRRSARSFDGRPIHGYVGLDNQ
jgi:hypothetical protein